MIHRVLDESQLALLALGPIERGDLPRELAALPAQLAAGPAMIERYSRPEMARIWTQTRSTAPGSGWSWRCARSMLAAA